MNGRDKQTLLKTRSRISYVEIDKAGLTMQELIDAGFRTDGPQGWRLEA